MNALITGVGSTTAQSVMKGLRGQSEYDVRIVGTDINTATDIAGSDFCDVFYTVPLATEEQAYIDALLDIIRTENADLLIPIVDIELDILSKHRDEIQSETDLLLSDRETVMTCNEKIRTHEFFEANDIPTPRTVAVDGELSRDELADRVSPLTYPLVAKPNVGVSSRDVYTIHSPAELCLLDRIDDPIVQEQAYGTEYTIDVFHDGDRPISAVPRKRLETRAGISYKGETVTDTDLIEYGKRIADEVGIYGPANIQCFKNDDKIQFFEINPRFSGSLPLSIEAGRNSPLFALQMSAGDPIGPIDPFDEVRMCRRWSEVYYDRQ